MGDSLLNILGSYVRSKIIRCDHPARRRMLRWTTETEQTPVVTRFGNWKDQSQT